MSGRLVEVVSYDASRHGPKTKSGLGRCSYWFGCPDNARAKWSVAERNENSEKLDWYAVCDACLRRAEGLDQSATRRQPDRLMRPRRENERVCDRCFTIVPANRYDEATRLCEDCQ